MKTMSAGFAGDSCSDELRGWAYAQFEATGGSVDRLVGRAVDLFCGDAGWVRAFVMEQVRDEVRAGVTGYMRRQRQGSEEAMGLWAEDGRDIRDGRDMLDEPDEMAGGIDAGVAERVADGLILGDEAMVDRGRAGARDSRGRRGTRDAGMSRAKAEGASRRGRGRRAWGDDEE
jgi:hypothetical protein